CMTLPYKEQAMLSIFKRKRLKILRQKFLN
ncbi:hypothetical protein, partial [uncultured Gammaproteobacteria bacterium]